MGPPTICSSSSSFPFKGTFLKFLSRSSSVALTISGKNQRCFNSPFDSTFLSAPIPLPFSPSRPTKKRGQENWKFEGGGGKGENVGKREKQFPFSPSRVLPPPPSPSSSLPQKLRFAPSSPLSLFSASASTHAKRRRGRGGRRKLTKRLISYPKAKRRKEEGE